MRPALQGISLWTDLACAAVLSDHWKVKFSGYIFKDVELKKQVESSGKF